MKSIKIGARNVDLVFVRGYIKIEDDGDGEDSKDDTYALGRCLRDQSRILLSTINPDKERISQDVIVTTLLHEILHLLFFDAGIHKQINQDSEEAIVTVLAPKLAQVIRDNPRLAKALQTMRIGRGR